MRLHPFRTYCAFWHPNRMNARFCNRCRLGVVPGWRYMLEDTLWFFARAFSNPVTLAVLAGVAMMVLFAAIVVLAVVLA